MQLQDLKKKSSTELLKYAEELGIENAASMRTQDMMYAILKHLAETETTLLGEGVLEVMPDGFGFLRSPEANYLAGPDDIYVAPQHIKRWGLRTGDTVSGQISAPKNSEKYFALDKIDLVNFEDPEKLRYRVNFDDLTPLYPETPIKMEHETADTKKKDYTDRIIDLICPQGFGQRSLIVAPPRTGKTIMLQNIAHAISANYPKAHLIMLLIDERPEEVTDMQRSIKGKVIYSTFDEQPQHHVKVAEMVLARAQRLVEHGKDVIILCDEPVPDH